MKHLSWKNAYRFINPRVDASGIHQWPFDPSFPLEVQFWYYDRPREIRMNRHDYFELILMDRGEAVFQVQDRFLDLKEGDLFVVGNSLFHRLIYTGTRLKAPRIMFLPQLICPAGTSGEDSDYLIPFLVQDPGFPHVVSAGTGIPKRIRTLMKRIHDRLPARSAPARLCAKTYLKMILAELVEHYASYGGSKSTFEARHRNLDRLRPVFDFIATRYGDSIDLTDVASIVSMSNRSFTRFFKKVTGQTFVDYLNGFRIEKARRLLATGNKTIAEISQEVGFCNQSYFGAVFRSLAQMSARQYMKQIESAKEAPAIARRGPRANLR